MSITQALIIDDNETAIDVLAVLLSFQDVAYTSIQDPNQLKSAIPDSTQFDVIFLDLEMPGLSGYEVLDILKNDLSVTAPIIAYSVHSPEMPTTQEKGFDGFLSKPLQRDRFPNQLKRILDGEKIWEHD